MDDYFTFCKASFSLYIPLMHLSFLKPHNAVDSHSVCMQESSDLSVQMYSLACSPPFWIYTTGFCCLGVEPPIHLYLIASFFIPFLCFSIQFANPVASCHLQIIHSVLSSMLLINVFKQTSYSVYSLLVSFELNQCWLCFTCSVVKLCTASYISSSPILHHKYYFFQNWACDRHWCLGCVSSSTWLLQEHTDNQAFYGL